MKKITHGFVKEQFKVVGYELLTTEYNSSAKKLGYICPKGHRHNISWNNWQQGHRCPYCAKVGRPTIEFIRSEFEKEGYKLLTTDYKNCFQKLDYICSEGHKHSTGWSNWQAGYRCPYCIGLGKPTIEFIRSEFAKEDYQLLTKEYINRKQKLYYICPEGHRHNISWAAWKYQNQRCPHCAGNGKLTIEFIGLEFAKEDYKLLTSQYVNAREKLEYECSSGHRHNISWYNWKSGKRCSTCMIINLSGENHYNWKGGISCEPYCDVWADKEFKKDILERDNHECQNPDCSGINHLLCLHHIDYNKKECGPSNLITLCKSCNSKANYGRKRYTQLYRTIMNKKHGYVYGEING